MPHTGCSAFLSQVLCVQGRQGWVAAQPSSKSPVGKLQQVLRKVKEILLPPKKDPFSLKVNREVKQCRRHHNKRELLREQSAAAVNMG